MTNLPTRLRTEAENADRAAARWRLLGGHPDIGCLTERASLMRAAADEIEKLRQGVQDMGCAQRTPFSPAPKPIQDQTMSETTTTPGPWEARGQHVYSPQPSCPVAWCGGGSAVGVDGSRRIGRDESEANARLIASAPCMLDALTVMDAALAGQFPGGPGGFGASEDLMSSVRDAWIQIRAVLAHVEAY